MDIFELNKHQITRHNWMNPETEEIEVWKDRGT
jgi:hypothetical protein